MNLIPSLLQSEWIKALGWTFVHSLWQIALIGLVLFVILKFIPGRSAHVRYTISTIALWLVLVMALATFIIMLPDTRVLTQVSGKLILLPNEQPTTLASKVSAWLEARIPMMLSIWSIGVAILMARLIISIFWVKHIRQTAVPEAELQLMLNQLIQKLRIKTKPGASSTSLISSPVTIGHLKPVILFPVGIINQLTPQEVEAILTHELAHIVRRDYLSNLIQSFIETLFYYHPITWWISGMVRTERENRADDLAVTWCGDHLAYAKALLTVQEMQVRQGPALAIGFSSRKGAMLARIQRILHLPYKNHNQMEKTVLLSLSTLCFLTFTLSSHTKPETVQEEIIDFETTISVSAEITDSIPAKGIYRIHKKTDDQDISVEVENGAIKELKVDGKEIQPSEFEGYNAVIDELFGGMHAPADVHGFEYMMPHMPVMPNPSVMPEMPIMIEGYNFEMPEIPEIPHTPGFRFGYGFDGDLNTIFSDSSTIVIYDSKIKGKNFQLTADTIIMNGKNKIIIYHGKDSSVINTHQFHGSAHQPFFYGHGAEMDEAEMRKHAEAWRAQSDQWREQQKHWSQQWRSNADQIRAEKELLRSLNRNNYRLSEESQSAIELELSKLNELNEIYITGRPRLDLSEELVKDGLIQPGTEVKVQLTPDKLKINGEKMPAVIHQKYLDLYEHQQGVELSGNSKVEFTTKSKQRM